MKKIDSSIKQIKKYINEKTNNNPDYIFKNVSLFEYKINVIFCESLSSRDIINNFILEFLEEINSKEKFEIKDILTYLQENIPTHKINTINTYEDLFYNLASGYTIVSIDGLIDVLAIETKAILNSAIGASVSEIVIKGPKDAFTENYQLNIGLIRKRIKSTSLCLKEMVVGTRSKSKVCVFYVKDIADDKLVNDVMEKIKKIDIDNIADSNYIADTISGNKKRIFPIFISTERPDKVSMHLLGGRIAILVENSQYVIILPALFVDFFHATEDYYQESINTNFTRIIRMFAFLTTIFIPALYIAITTYNFEAIPEKLLISFSSQRAGVPFPAILEAFMMILTFEILRETDIRVPSKMGSSISIVGALVLGEAAVSAGIVSPIMVIVVAITAISGLITSSFEFSNGIRLWRIIVLIFGAIAGLVGVFIAALIFLINVTSIKSFGIPYFAPISPFIKNDLGDSIFLTNKRRFFKRNKLIAKKDQDKQVIS
jgi:spore germination protein KA